MRMRGRWPPIMEQTDMKVGRGRERRKRSLGLMGSLLEKRKKGKTRKENELK